MTRAAIVVLLALVPQERKLDEAVVRVSAYFWEKRIELADWCRLNELPQEARIHYEFLVKNIQEKHPYKEKAQTRLTGPWKEKPNTASQKKWEEYQKKLETYYREVGTRSWECVRLAKEAGKDDQYRQMLEKTVEFCFDQPDARKERGEEKVEGLGWVPKADAELARAAVEAADEKDDAAHDAWERSWVVRSKHFVVRSDLPAKEMMAAVEDLEALHARFFEEMGGRFKAPEERSGVCIFRRAGDFDKVRESLPGALKKGIAGFYHALTGVAYARGAGGVLRHEAVHLLADRGSGPKMYSALQYASSRSDAADNYWVMEGTADAIAKPRSSVKEVAEAMRKGSLRPLRRLVEMSGAEFAADEDAFVYAWAHAVARFFLEADGGKRRDKFLDFFRGFYAGTCSVEALERAAGAKLPEVERAFLEWLKTAE